ncbi:NACHT domain-containing protein [Actinokineospora globicatena]|uniref:NACHT domain-containing protein n=1 Tax=Actinokineospora globicatena TaxID=103729 RepID=A0A9W6QFL4_9PSEU|nr:NACHT domain-containing protein [Actinokineospora globicatena]GLW90061.1 hypothetical protein Aglo03_08770 [Actinokineospora globicatena]
MDTENTVDGHVGGNVIQAGTIGSITTSPPPLAYDYRPYVRQRFASPEFIGRSAELRAMAEFCTASASAGKYFWLRADAWSGKTALVAQFALNPPDGVALVPFFVTATAADQRDHYAFLDSVTPSLAALVGAQIPPEVPRTRLEPLYTDLLNAAAERHGNVVLVVDGLDEDCGVDGSPHAHSIAALLPAHPPPGLRVILSSRPHPAVPTDVPDHHPLHDPAIVYPLTAHPQARARRDTLNGDLKALYKHPLGRSLLGYITASGGGLTVRDLGELHGQSEWAIADVLGTSVARSFATTPDGAYVLGHAQLQETAVAMLGPELERYRSHISAWATSYQEQAWPRNTPPYLFKGYFAMLNGTNDIDTLLALATDPDRHDRADSDGAAIAEINAVQERLLQSDDPDLVALCRLAVHRGHIMSRNSHLPSSLPAGWAWLGDDDRAESTTRSMPQAHDRIRALLSTARIQHAQDRPDRAAKSMDTAERQARQVKFASSIAIRWVAEACGEVSQFGHADELLRALDSHSDRALGMAKLARHSARIEDSERALRYGDVAEPLIDGCSDDDRLSVLVDLAVAAHYSGDAAGLDRFTTELESLLARELAPESVAAWTASVTLASKIHNYDLALGFARKVAPGWPRRSILADVFESWSRHNSADAERAAQTGADEQEQIVMCAGVAAGLTTDKDRADRLLSDVYERAVSLGDPVARSETLLIIASMAVKVGNLDLAEAIIDDHGPSATTIEALLQVSFRAAHVKNRDLCERMLRMVEEVARKRSPNREDEWSHWVRVLCDNLDLDGAERLARTVVDPEAAAKAWAVIALAAVGAGELGRATQALRRIGIDSYQHLPRLDVIRALSRADPLQAVDLATAVTSPLLRARALEALAAATGDPSHLDGAAAAVLLLTDPSTRVDELERLLERSADLGDHPRAEHLLTLLKQAYSDRASSDDGPAARSGTYVNHSRVRSMTEIAESHRLRFDFWDPCSALLREGPSADDDAEPQERRRRVAQDLCEEDWRPLAEAAIAVDPACYQAIRTELDRLHRRTTSS